MSCNPKSELNPEGEGLLSGEERSDHELHRRTKLAQQGIERGLKLKDLKNQYSNLKRWMRLVTEQQDESTKGSKQSWITDVMLAL